MKKILLTALLALFSSAMYAATDWGTSCSTIKRLYAWQGGSDQYGLRIEHTAPYAGCEGGYYIPHIGENRQFVYSTALTAFTADLVACVQIELVSNSIGTICKLNQIHLKK